MPAKSSARRAASAAPAPGPGAGGRRCARGRRGGRGTRRGRRGRRRTAGCRRRRTGSPARRGAGPGPWPPSAPSRCPSPGRGPRARGRRSGRRSRAGARRGRGSAGAGRRPPASARGRRCRRGGRGVVRRAWPRRPSTRRRRRRTSAREFLPWRWGGRRRGARRTPVRSRGASATLPDRSGGAVADRHQRRRRSRYAPEREYSRPRVRSTRNPSAKVRRLVSPWMRGFSVLLTSATCRPACEKRQVSSVSISKPSPQSMPPGGGGVAGVGQREQRQEVRPEGVVAVAEIGVTRAEYHVGEPVEAGVARTTQRRDVLAAGRRRRRRTGFPSRRRRRR